MLIDQQFSTSPSPPPTSVDGATSMEADKPLMSLSAYSIQGKRNHMEDYFDIGYQMKPCDQRQPNEWPYEYFYFGIFDGHGGSEAANYVKRNLLKFITKQKDFWSNDDDDVKRAIRTGFAETQSAMKKELPNWTRTSRVLPSTAGTTASVLFIKNGKFYTGHVGDSRIVISQENLETKHWISHQLTDDHKPESAEELKRINRAGGEVKAKIGVHRVVWRRPVFTREMEFELSSKYKSLFHNHYMNMTSTYPISESMVESFQTIPFLAIARSLGDFWSINPTTGQYVVSPEPDVSCRPIQANDKCILLATDGLWNVVNSSLATRILQELEIIKSGNRQYHKNEYFTTDNFYDVAGHDSENHAQSLVYIAYQIWERKRLRSDNITVVVAVLHDILDYFHSTKVDKNNNESNNRMYTTRRASILSSEKVKLDEKVEDSKQVVSKFVDDMTIQIEETHNFFEKIRSISEPKFCLPKLIDIKQKELLERRLLLPPSLLRMPGLAYPANYTRFANAPCRQIYYENEYSESFVLIKNFSDDPADEDELPIRTGKNGKQVKDATAQATQSIHDFGEPWSGEPQSEWNEDDDDDFIINMSEAQRDKIRKDLKLAIKLIENDDPETKISMADLFGRVQAAKELESSTYQIDDDDDTELVFENELNNEDELVFEHELDEDCIIVGEDVDKKEEEEATISKEKRNKRKKQKSEEKVDKSMPQFRCLLNYSSPKPLRRSKRNAPYISVSENVKRKNQINLAASVPKSKRRRSQPGRCSLSRA